MAQQTDTTPQPAPPPAVLLYDGSCRFCRRSARWAKRIAKPGSVQLISFRDPGVIDRFPGVTAEACEDAMHLVEPPPHGCDNSRVTRGAEAAARLLMTRWTLKPIAHLYYLPPLRWLANRAYAMIARNRFALGGRCDGSGACSIGRGPPPDQAD